MRGRFVVFILIFQSILFAAHAFVYKTWMTFQGTASSPGISPLAWATVALSVSFTAASLLAFRWDNILVRVFYKVAAAWLGIVCFLFLAAIVCWGLAGGAAISGRQVDGKLWSGIFFGVAAAVSIYGMVNASLTRVKRIRVALPNLPEKWRGRVAALVSDMHLGHVREAGFTRRIARLIQRYNPAAVFIAGDLYDGTAADVNRLAAPLAGIDAPMGTYFVTGNHEGFQPRARYLEAVRRAGVRVLHNEKVTIEGLQLVGVNYADSRQEEHFRSVLRGLKLDRGSASVLLTHVPDKLKVAEEAGIGLQLSGHTHGGQFFPFTWITERVWGAFTYGLKRFGKLLVYTSSGAGTWGPPLRIGTNPEIVLIEFV
jgi:hypothetical protein